MRSTRLSRLLLLAIIPIFSHVSWAQEQGSSNLTQITGRKELRGTFTDKVVRKTFSDQLVPGLYRLTYLSESSPAVVTVQTEDGQLIGRSAPTAPLATVLSGRGRPVERKPPGLCTSDVAPEEACAGEKVHFRITQLQKLVISVEGLPQSPGDFTVLLDPLKDQPETHSLPVKTTITAYLAFGSESAGKGPQAEFALELSKGQRVGILGASPDFTTVLELFDQKGNLVASNSDFNGLLDPCREVQIDHLPKFDPLSQSNSYFAYQSNSGGTFKVRISPRYRTETGLYILRSFDVTEPAITTNQMRTGFVSGQQSSEFMVNLPPGWKPEGSQIVAYSSLPIHIELTDAQGQNLAQSSESKTNDFVSGRQLQNLDMLHSSSIALDTIDPARLATSRIRVTSKEPVADQFFLVGLATRWGSCGGGAVEPITILYPAVSDFTDQGYPLTAPKMSVAEIEVLLYSAARNGLRWYFLLQGTGVPDKDPQVLISSYARYLPERSSITELLVEFQVAVRVQYSPATGAARFWTRVERHGYKEKDWHADAPESAKAQQALATQIEQALRGRTK